MVKTLIPRLSDLQNKFAGKSQKLSETNILTSLVCRTLGQKKLARGHLRPQGGGMHSCLC